VLEVRPAARRPSGTGIVPGQDLLPGFGRLGDGGGHSGDVLGAGETAVRAAALENIGPIAGVGGDLAHLSSSLSESLLLPVFSVSVLVLVSLLVSPRLRISASTVAWLMSSRLEAVSRVSVPFFA